MWATVFSRAGVAECPVFKDSSTQSNCQRMIDGLLQGSPSYVSPLTDLESDLSASLNKSSDRRHHHHPQHHHHLQLHTNRKLLYLEGLEKIWFCSLLRYTLNHCIQLDFFFICVFLKRYRQNTVKYCHFCVTLLNIFNVTLLFKSRFALHSCLNCILPYSLVWVLKNRRRFFQNWSMKMLDDINLLLYASSFECSWGLIKCSSSFWNIWILVFTLLPCVCLCVTMF